MVLLLQILNSLYCQKGIDKTAATLPLQCGLALTLGGKWAGAAV
jgi:hypothetical protein